MKTRNIFHIPLADSVRKIAISDPRVHTKHLKHAIDFPLKEGTEVLAALDGEVIEVKADSHEGGLEKKYIGNKYLNFITIKHANEEYSQYAHLRHNGACVKVGQKVKAGQVIGYSGNTGYSSAPHLHFHIFHFVETKIGWETLEIQFHESLGIIRNIKALTEEEKAFLENC